MQSWVYGSAFDFGSVYAYQSVSLGCVQRFCDMYCCDHVGPCSYLGFLVFSAITDVLVDYLTSFYNIINSFIYPLLHPASSALLTGGLTGCAMGGGSDIPQHLVGPECVDNYIQGSRDSGSSLIWAGRTTGGWCGTHGLLILRIQHQTVGDLWYIELFSPCQWSIAISQP